MNNWILQIDKNTQSFIEAFGSLTPEQLNWKPNPKSWSIAQVVDHLIVLNKSYFPTLESLEAGNYRPPFVAKIGILVSLFGKLILSGVQPDRKRKVKTFPIWEPGSSELPDDILDRFRQNQEELKARIQKTEPFIRAGAVISSPAAKYIVYKLETAVDIIVTHEQRHFEQAREVQELMKNQATNFQK